MLVFSFCFAMLLFHYYWNPPLNFSFENISLFRHDINLPPQSVHCMPNLSSNFWVRKKFRTEPRREKARVRPKAKASSFPLNQKAVMRFWTTNKDAKERAAQEHPSGFTLQRLYAYDFRWPYWTEIHCLIQTGVGLWASVAADRESLWSGSPARTSTSPKHTGRRRETLQLQRENQFTMSSHKLAVWFSTFADKIHLQRFPNLSIRKPAMITTTAFLLRKEHQL